MADLGEKYVYIVDQTQKSKLQIFEDDKIKIERNLVALILKSPPEIEDAPGVVTFIAQRIVMAGSLSALPAWIPVILFTPVAAILLDRVRT